MADIPHVQRGTTIASNHQNALIDQLNANTAAISDLEVGGGGLPPADIQAMIDTSVNAHVADLTPHPAYDDIQSLQLVFENGLV